MPSQISVVSARKIGENVRLAVQDSPAYVLHEESP